MRRKPISNIGSGTTSHPIQATVFALLILLGLTGWNCKSDQARPLGSSVPPKVELSEAERMFEPKIQEFERMERDSPSVRGGIVFTGSSSIRKWETLREDMAPMPVANRGFGGSIIRQVSHYASRIILPLQPRLIVFYCGENDIANEVYPHTDPLKNYKDFVAIVHHSLPETRILYLSMKPSPLRWEYWDKFQQGNELIRAYSQTDARLDYLDVSQVMIGKSGRPLREIWVSDSLHMNVEGYADWTDLIRPVVARIWQEVQQVPVGPGSRQKGIHRGGDKKD